MDWKIKVDDDGHVVLQDGKPVYTDPDGKEITLDPPNMYGKIIDLGKESKGHRERADAHELVVKLFDGVEDVPAWHVEATKALQTVKDFNDKDWLKADKVEKLKADMKLAYEDQSATLKKDFTTQLKASADVVGKKDAQIRVLMVSNKFATSTMFGGQDPKTTLPPEIAETYFGKNFKVEEDDKTGVLNLVAYYNNGDPVYSRTNPGELALFDEALSSIFEAYPGNKALLRGKGAGSGAGGGQGGSDDEDDDVKKLETDYAEAQKRQDAKAMVAIKNKLFKARKAARGAA